MKEYFNRIPREYRDTWIAVSELCDKVSSISEPEDKKLWPVLALCHKSVFTFNSISYLLSCYQFSDCLILCRSILDNEIQIRWMIDEDTSNRAEEYLQSVNNTKIEFNNKLKNKASIVFQLLADIFKIAPIEVKSRKDKSNIRTRGGEVGIEGTYDVFYWISSKFVHADILSVANYKPDFFDQEKELSIFFEFNKGAIFNNCIVSTPTLLTLHVITRTNEGLRLGLDEDIERTWEVLRRDFSNNTGATYSEEIKRGTISVGFDNGTTKEFVGKNSHKRK